MEYESVCVKGKLLAFELCKLFPKIVRTRLGYAM